MAYEKILVAVNGSRCSLMALRHAVELAGALGAELDVLHVVEEQEPEPEDAMAAEEIGETMAEAARRFGTRLHRIEKKGDPARAILETSARRGHDLIVMGTHGRIGRMHMIAYNVAETVIRNAACPVLVVRVVSGAEETFKDRLRGGMTLGEQVVRG